MNKAEVSPNAKCHADPLDSQHPYLFQLYTEARNLRRALETATPSVAPASHTDARSEVRGFSEPLTPLPDEEENTQTCGTVYFPNFNTF